MSPATTAHLDRDAESSSGEQVHALRCLEVWGGNEEFHNAIAVPGINAYISSDPFEGALTGGDIHYVSMCGAGKISRFALADVAGHGASVGDIADRLRRLMRKHINTLDQTRFARAINREFAELSRSGRFATAILTTYFAPTDHLIICNAGHPRPLWLHAESGTWDLLSHDSPQRVDEVRNLPLGIIEPTDYQQFAVRLDKDDVVLLFTDSLIEAAHPERGQLGEQGLLDLVRGLGTIAPEEISRTVLDAVDAYRGGRPAGDDQTLLVMHHNAQDPPKQAIGERIRVMAKMLGLVGD